MYKIKSTLSESAQQLAPDMSGHQNNQAKEENNECRSNFSLFNIFFRYSSVLSQLSSFSKIDTSTVATFIERFEAEWLLLQGLAAKTLPSDSYQYNVTQLLHNDNAKRDILLGLLFHCNSEFIGSLTNHHNNHTYAQLRELLLNYSSCVVTPLANEPPECNNALNSASETQCTITLNSSEEHHNPNDLMNEMGITDTNTINEPTREASQIDDKIPKFKESNRESSISQQKKHQCSQLVPNHCPMKKTEYTPSIPRSPIAKKSNKRARTVKISEKDEEQEEERFDYSKAPSLLCSNNKAGGREGNSRDKKSILFDPYSKSSDTLIGKRRIQVRAGKSHTFRR